MNTTLTTQAETNAYLAQRIRIGRCIEVTLSPAERIDLGEWIAPHECCSECDEATPGLRLDAQGHPCEDCAACKGSGMLITTWGTAQTERWKAGERYSRPDGVDDDGPPIGPIRIIGGVAKHARDIERQAALALVKCVRTSR